MIRRLLGQEFKEFEATVGVDFSEYLIKNIDENDPDICLSVQIWDTCKKNKLFLISWGRKISSSDYKVNKI